MSTQHTTCVESWKDIPGYDGRYQVSDQGRVKSMARSVHYKSGRVDHLKERMLKQAWNGKYFFIMLCKEGVGKIPMIHQLVLLAFVGPCPKGMQCRHMDGDATNNCLSNLQWGTPKENYDDRARHGTLRFKP